MIAYPAMLDVPRELVTFVARLLADEGVARGTRTNARALTCGKQAFFAVWFRERRDIALIGRGLGISQATSYRYENDNPIRPHCDGAVSDDHRNTLVE